MPSCFLSPFPPVSSHPPNLFLSNIPPQLALDHGIPPFKQHALTDKAEPRRKLEIPPLTHLRLGITEQLPHLLLAHPRRVAHLVHIYSQLGRSTDEENIVDLVLAPLAVRGREVVDAGEKVKGGGGHLRGRDAEFVTELALGGAFGALDAGGEVAVAGFGGVGQWVRAAGVGPHVGEGDLFAGALLEEELVRGWVEEEDAEGAVEEALVDVAHEVAGLFGGGAQRLVVPVEDDADFVHEADLFGVMAAEVVVLGGGVEMGGGGGGGG